MVTAAGLISPSAFRQLFEASPHPYLILRPDAAFTIAAVNDRYLVATGTRREDIVGRGLFEVFPDNPDDHTGSGVSDLRASLERVLRERIADTMGVQKYDIPRHDGSGEFELRYWSPVNTPVFGEDDDIVYIIHHVEDITDFIRLREQGQQNDSAHIERAEAEVLRRAQEVKVANRQLKADIEKMSHNQVEWAKLNEYLKALDRPVAGRAAKFFQEFPLPLPIWVRTLLALVIFALSLAIRLAMLPVGHGVAFLTFYPATAIAVFLCGIGPGLLLVLMSVGAILFIFTPPYWSFAFLEFPFVQVTTFMSSALIIILIVHLLQRRTREAREARRWLEVAMAELKQREAELLRSNRELDEFAYIASHDLKEPLRGIHNYASFLREDYGDRLDEEGRNYLDRIQRLVERQSALVERLLAYSRIGSAALHLELVDIESIVNSVAQDLEVFLAERQVELRRSGSLPKTICDPGLIGEIFQNLITNGAKYNDKPVKWVEVGCETRDGQIVFHVRDNGIGIPPQHHDNVFKIFKRLHEQGKYGGGTGAGLTIVKKIVERHGGRIWLESAVGEGTTFYFTLSGEHDHDGA